MFELPEHLVKDLIAYRQITRFSKQEHAGAGNQKPAISNQLLRWFVWCERNREGGAPIMKAWSGRPRATFARLTSIKSGRIDSPCTNHAQKKIVRKSVVLYLHRSAVATPYRTTHPHHVQSGTE